MPDATTWRDLYRKITREYAGRTPNGSPPVPLVEGMVNLESGGDPNNITPTGDGRAAVGLAQIVPGGFEYGVATSDPDFIRRCGQTPNLHDPECNLRIMVLGLQARQNDGYELRQAGKTGAYVDWIVASGGYLGAATQEGPTGERDILGTGFWEYVGHVKDYVSKTFGGDVWTAIDDLQPGSADIERKSYNKDAGTNRERAVKVLENLGEHLTFPSPGDIWDGITDVDDMIKSIYGGITSFIQFLPRLGVILLAVLLIVGGGILTVGI